MTTLSPADKINSLRQRILAGEDPSPEEMREVIAQIRSERSTASARTTKAKTPPAPLDLDKLLGGV